jgi:hypothetical protein
MNSPELFVVSTTAYLVAFAVLAVLALMMRLITLLFPEREKSDDAAAIAAVKATYQALFPETTVTKIEETK